MVKMRKVLPVSLVIGVFLSTILTLQAGEGCVSQGSMPASDIDNLQGTLKPILSDVWFAPNPTHPYGDYWAQLRTGAFLRDSLMTSEELSRQIDIGIIDSAFSKNDVERFANCNLPEELIAEEPTHGTKVGQVFCAAGNCSFGCSRNVRIYGLGLAEPGSTDDVGRFKNRKDIGGLAGAVSTLMKEHPDIRVINYSATASDWKDVENALRMFPNVLLFVASGNDAGNHASKIRTKQIAAVGSLHPSLLPSTFSNASNNLQIASPSDISIKIQNGYFAGTSGASPGAAGAALNVIKVNPNLGPVDVLKVLQATALPLAGADYNQFTGSGMVNIPASTILAREIRLGHVKMSDSIADIRTQALPSLLKWYNENQSRFAPLDRHALKYFLTLGSDRGAATAFAEGQRQHGISVPDLSAQNQIGPYSEYVTQIMENGPDESTRLTASKEMMRLAVPLRRPELAKKAIENLFSGYNHLKHSTDHRSAEAADSLYYPTLTAKLDLVEFFSDHPERFQDYDNINNIDLSNMALGYISDIVAIIENRKVSPQSRLVYTLRSWIERNPQAIESFPGDEVIKILNDVGLNNLRFDMGYVKDKVGHSGSFLLNLLPAMESNLSESDLAELFDVYDKKPDGSFFPWSVGLLKRKKLRDYAEKKLIERLKSIPSQSDRKKGILGGLALLESRDPLFVQGMKEVVERGIIREFYFPNGIIAKLLLRDDLAELLAPYISLDIAGAAKTGKICPVDEFQDTLLGCANSPVGVPRAIEKAVLARISDHWIEGLSVFRYAAALPEELKGDHLRDYISSSDPEVLVRALSLARSPDHSSEVIKTIVEQIAEKKLSLEQLQWEAVKDNEELLKKGEVLQDPKINAEIMLNDWQEAQRAALEALIRLDRDRAGKVLDKILAHPDEYFTIRAEAFVLKMDLLDHPLQVDELFQSAVKENNQDALAKMFDHAVSRNLTSPELDRISETFLRILAPANPLYTSSEIYFLQDGKRN